jgi:hypothetical protein
VDKLDLSHLRASYTKRGPSSYPPRYDANDSRIRLLQKEHLPPEDGGGLGRQRVVHVHNHSWCPDHTTTITKFILLVLLFLGGYFAQILAMAHIERLLDLTVVFLDWFKVKADASRHHAISFKRAN